MKKLLRIILYTIAGILVLWLTLEAGMRAYVAGPLKTDFYSSITRELIPKRQIQYGVQIASGSGWIHLGWIADPDNETYRIETLTKGNWREIGQAEFGSFLLEEAGQAQLRVIAIPKDGNNPRVLGEVSAAAKDTSSPIFIPRYVLVASQAAPNDIA